jgi:hypothetical protein
MGKPNGLAWTDGRTDSVALAPTHTASPRAQGPLAVKDLDLACDSPAACVGPPC